VKNWTHHEAARRLHVPFGVAYGTDKDKVKAAVLEAANEVPYTLRGFIQGKREPEVWLVEFGDSSLNFELVVWLTKDAVMKPIAVKAAYLWAIETKLTEHGIQIPFPQRDLHVRSVFGKTAEETLSIFTAPITNQKDMSQ
jgi:small-conductance mechanosensitive channel